MGFTEALNTCLREKYATFNGRAARSEYWYFTLGITLIGAVLGGLLMLGMDFNTGEITGFGYLILVILGIFYLGIIIPGLAVGIRRLHDRNMSGWWYLGFIALSMIPFVGVIASIAFLVIFCLKGTDGDNRFGPDPLRPAARADVFA